MPCCTMLCSYAVWYTVELSQWGTWCCRMRSRPFKYIYDDSDEYDDDNDDAFDHDEYNDGYDDGVRCSTTCIMSKLSSKICKEYIYIMMMMITKIIVVMISLMTMIVMLLLLIMMIAFMMLIMVDIAAHCITSPHRWATIQQARLVYSHPQKWLVGR